MYKNKFFLLFINILLLLLVAIFIFVAQYLYKISYNKQIDFEQFFKFELPLFNFSSMEKWPKYEANYFSFEHPKNWDVIPMTLEQGELYEALRIEIPLILGISSAYDDSRAGFSAYSMKYLSDDKVIRNENIIIGGRNGLKWIRQQDKYVIYEYYTTGRDNSGLFFIKVRSNEENKKLEAQLDRLVASIRFK